MRISEAIVKAYWTHWYNLAQAGQKFHFKTIKDCQPEDQEDQKDQEDRDGTDTVEPMEADKTSEGEGPSGDEQQDDVHITPKSCKSEVAKFAFLRSLLPQSENWYHSVVSAVACMEVRVYLVQDHHPLIPNVTFRVVMTRTLMLPFLQSVFPGGGTIPSLMKSSTWKAVRSSLP